MKVFPKHACDIQNLKENITTELLTVPRTILLLHLSRGNSSIPELPLCLNVEKCHIYPSQVNPRFCPITRTLGQFIRPVRAELPTLWKHPVRHKRGVQKKLSFLLAVLQVSMIYTSWWFEIMSQFWTNIQSKVIGCPIIGSTFVWSSRSQFPQ